jgi:hypothetical protein
VALFGSKGSCLWLPVLSVILDLFRIREQMQERDFMAKRNLKIKIRTEGATIEVIIPDVLLCAF